MSISNRREGRTTMATAADHPLPPLEPVVAALLAKCGPHADLLLDCVISKAHHFHPAVKFAQQVGSEQLQLGRALWTEPLLLLLQRRTASCGCSPLGGLALRSAVLSGSQMEGFGDVEATLQLRSDHDTMFELGPVRWSGSAGGSAPAGVDRQTPRLRPVPTANPGFVQLLQEPLSSCRHSQPLVFSAAEVRQLMQQLVLVHQRPGDQLAASGPATALTTGGLPRVAGANEDDLVPCLLAPWWPAEEFLTRRRTCDWPPAEAREEVARFGVHLVPVGCRGSASELTEWRLSFSRAEVVAAWHLTETQRCSLIALKACKARLGPLGKGVKSYFMKTALYWLCQERPSASWCSITQGARAILDFLEEAAAAGRLPSFFWADINLLRLASAEELAAMRHTIRLLLGACAQLHMRTLRPVLEAPGAPLSERQLRLCLARALVLEAAVMYASCGLAGIHRQESFQAVVPGLLLSGAVGVLRRMYRLLAALTGPQLLLLRALAVAPPELRPRLSAVPGGGFSWDAGPLLALLTEDQWQMLLVNPRAVAAWCRQQGLTADLTSPRGRADLLLHPSLLKRALRACAPDFISALERSAAAQQRGFRPQLKEKLPPLPEAMREAAENYHSDLAGKLRRALSVGDGEAEELARDWRQEMRRHWQSPETKQEYRRIRRSVLDAWQLRAYARDNV